MQEILNVKNVSKYYKSASILTKALDNLSLTVDQGEFTAIMGASGSGKTTLLQVIATIEPLSGGEIEIGGICLSKQSEPKRALFRRDHLGFIFQEYNLLDTLTVEENILLPLSLQHVDVHTAQKQLHTVATTFEIEDQLKKFPYELSGGQRQRVACARAVITKPTLILADEPTGALDSYHSKQLMQTFLLMNRSLDATILMVTHDPVVGSYASRVLFLKDGQIFHEIHKGDRNRQAMYQEIISVMASLGGETDVYETCTSQCETSNRK